MADWPEKLKADISNVKGKIAKLREDTTGGIFEKRARQIGQSPGEMGEELLLEIDSHLERISENITSGYYQIEDGLKPHKEKVKSKLMKVREDVKEHRRGMTGGKLEDKTREALKTVEKELGKILEKDMD